MPRILLVAPDTDLRRSLEFALRAEGFDVTCRANIGAREQPSGYGCTVLDHHAAGTDSAAAASFCKSFSPVILLANQQPHPLSPWAFRTVLKPLLGRALSDAVHDALGAREPTTYSP